MLILPSMKRIIQATQNFYEFGPQDPRREKIMALIGLMLGVALIGGLTCLLFAFAVNLINLRYENFAYGGYIILAGTILGVVHGAIIGPLIALRIARGKISRRVAHPY